MPDPTFYNRTPVCLYQFNATDLQAATNPLVVEQEEFPINTRAVDAWVEVEVSAGSAGVVNIFHEQGTTEVAIVSAADATSAGLTDGLLAGGHEPIAADGNLKTRKTGTGAALVYSYCVFALRPDMTP